MQGVEYNYHDEVLFSNISSGLCRTRSRAACSDGGRLLCDSIRLRLMQARIILHHGQFTCRGDTFFIAHIKVIVAVYGEI